LLPASLQQRRPDHSQEDGAAVEQRMKILENEEEFGSVHVAKATLHARTYQFKWGIQELREK
jgi:hypothetical protein